MILLKAYTSRIQVTGNTCY